MAATRSWVLLCLLSVIVALAGRSLADDVVSGEVDVEKVASLEDGEQFDFQAETGRLMDIIVHSLYSNRDIFLRELVSNAADASDKYRMIKLGKDGALDEEMEIRIGWNKTARTISVTDTGVGMSRDELVSNLGTIAKSGTSSFLEKHKDISKEDENSLIGQFGVGFYSSFLVATRVNVTSKPEDGPQHMWSSTADGTFTVVETEDKDAERGTTVTLILRDDAEDFLSFGKLEGLLKKYSAFIEFPIFLQNFKEKKFKVDAEGNEVPVVGEEEEDEIEEEDEDDYDDEDDEDDDYDDEDDEDEVDDDELGPDHEDKKDEEPEEPEEPEDDAADDAEDDDEIDVEDEDASEDEDDASEDDTETITKDVSTWKRVNEQKPLWRRDPANVTDDEYADFYKTIRTVKGDAIAKSHFSAEGDVDFKALLYIPSRPASDQFDSNQMSSKESVRLYVRKVLLKGYFEDGLLPRYLGFITGVVDSDDLPINISRETLQQSKALDLIRKKLVRKTFEMFKTLMKEEKDEEEEGAKDTATEEEGAKDAATEEETAEKEDEEKTEPTEADEEAVSEEEESADEAPEKKKKKETKFIKFWKTYSIPLKLGIVEDRTNQKRLVQLMRFRTSKTDADDDNDFVSLDEYVARMKEGQQYIYYLTGSSLQSIRASPFLERLADKGYEVLFLSDPIDEYWITSYTDHDGVRLLSISKDNFAFSKEDEKIAKKQMEEARKGVKPLSEKIKTTLEGKVERVKLSNRLRSVPMMISAERTGYTPNMELVARAQAFADPKNVQELRSKTAKKVVELNPYHPLVKKLAAMVSEGSEDDKLTETIIQSMYDTAMVASGFHIYDSRDYAARMSRILAASLDIDYEALEKELKTFSDEDTIAASEDLARKEEEAAAKEQEMKDDADASGHNIDMDDIKRQIAEHGGNIDDIDLSEDGADEGGADEEKTEL